MGDIKIISANVYENVYMQACICVCNGIEWVRVFAREIDNNYKITQ